LSETVLQASGALQMDSLFIDEGFGTARYRLVVPKSPTRFEALGQNGDRLIGVISHRAELTDRLPGLIRVDKGAGESAVGGGARGLTWASRRCLAADIMRASVGAPRGAPSQTVLWSLKPRRSYTASGCSFPLLSVERDDAAARNRSARVDRRGHGPRAPRRRCARCV